MRNMSVPRRRQNGYSKTSTLQMAFDLIGVPFTEEANARLERYRADYPDQSMVYGIYVGKDDITEAFVLSEEAGWERIRFNIERWGFKREQNIDTRLRPWGWSKYA